MESLEQEVFDAKFDALQTVARMAYEYIDNLKPGDLFLGPQAEAARHFSIGSEGYGIFIGCALNQLRRVVMDLDTERRIVSIVKIKTRRTCNANDDVVDALKVARTALAQCNHIPGVTEQAICKVDSAMVKLGVQP